MTGSRNPRSGSYEAPNESIAIFTHTSLSTVGSEFLMTDQEELEEIVLKFFPTWKPIAPAVEVILAWHQKHRGLQVDQLTKREEG